MTDGLTPRFPSVRALWARARALLKPSRPAPDPAPDPAPEPGPDAPPEEFGGPKGLEPTRYGDWERKGRAIDF